MQCMKTVTHIFFWFVVYAGFQVCGAADEAASDDESTADRCGYCPDLLSPSVELAIGTWITSSGASKFDEYRGLQGRTLNVDLAVKTRYLDENANYLWFDAQQLGLASRYLSLEGGKQGSYRIDFDYKQSRHWQFGEAKSPYQGVESDSLSLSDSLKQSMKDADDLQNITPQLHSLDVVQSRKQLVFAINKTFNKRWSSRIDFRYEKKEGVITTGAAMGSAYLNAMSVILPEPIDYQTRSIDLSALYSGNILQAQLGIRSHFFDNTNDYLRWDNLFTLPGSTTQSTEGQIALPPSSQHHQVYVRLGAQLSEKTQLFYQLNVGRMSQDDKLLPYTINTQNQGLTRSLPHVSTEARVDHLHTQAKLSHRVTEKLKLNGALIYHERNNKTPVANYDYVILDTANGDSRTNRAYDFKDYTAKLASQYRWSETLNSEMLLRRDVKKRRLQATNKTTEDMLGIKSKLHAFDSLDVSFQYRYKNRDYDNYLVTLSSENPLMRKYYLAKMKQHHLSGELFYLLTETTDLNLSLEYALTDYHDTEIGLTDAQNYHLQLDINRIVFEFFNISSYVAFEQYRSNQQGSVNGSSADWEAINTDQVASLGFGVHAKELFERLEFGVNYTLSLASGKTEFETSLTGGDLPDFESTRHTVNLYGSYRLKENMSLRLSYLLESYDEKNWQTDDLEAGDIPRVLTLLEENHNYLANLVFLSYAYQFE